MDDKNVQFEDAEGFTYGGKDKVQFKDIVLEHLRKIGIFGSCEFTGGYWHTQERPVSIGSTTTVMTTKTYIPDTREQYSNAVEYMADILFPHFDEEMVKAEERLKIEIEEAYEKYKDETKSSNRNAFRGERVTICRKLFRELCSFLYRKKYLEMGSMSD